MSSLAIIPARGGSKRIPRKNIREFRGEPILWYPIRAAKQVFDRVVVSTEDEEIARFAIKGGAEVIQRPMELADDITPSGEVIAHAADVMPDYDIVGCIYPTSVFATPQLLRKAVNELGDANCIFTVVKYDHPIQRALKSEGGLVQFANEDFRNVRTQDCEPRYHDAGQLFVMRREPLVRTRNLYSERMKPIIVNESEIQDIDTLEDWHNAEMKYEMLHGRVVERR